MKRLSLIIATYNRAQWVLETLGSVAAQKSPASEWECVVVNNNSTDNTSEVVEAFIASHPRLDIRLVVEIKQGLSHARNCGIENSTGEIVAIIDDDELINDDFIVAYISLFERNADIASAGGRIVARYRSARPAWMSPYTERPIANPMDFGAEEREFPAGRIPGGGNMAIRRSALDKYGVFNPELGRQGQKLIGGEENDLFERLRVGGERCWYTPAAVMYHLIPDEKLTRDYLSRLSYNIGISQRRRASIEGRGYLTSEIIKWVGTILIALGYTLTLRPAKGAYVVIMRYHITRGLLA